MADYTATEIDSDKAASIVELAENYVSEVERVFDLGRVHGLDSSTANPGESLEKVRERAAEEWSKMRQKQGDSQTPEQIQERARENWLKFRQEHADRTAKSGQDTRSKDRVLGRDAGKDVGKGIEEDDSDP